MPLLITNYLFIIIAYYLFFSGNAIFVIEPHDILPLSIFAFNDILKGLKGHKCIGCITSICFYVPMMKHIYTWVGAKSADKNNITTMLKNGFSPVLCPGKN